MSETDTAARERFDGLMAALDPPMAVVTTVAEGTRAGCLIGFHAQSAITEAGYCLWLSKANHTYRTALRADHFALHLLSDSDLTLAEAFGTRSGEDVDKFADVDADEDEYGVPLVRALPHRLLLDRVAVLDDGGDHVCVTTRVRDAQGGGPFTPLRLGDVDHLRPGREAEERVVEP